MLRKGAGGFWGDLGPFLDAFLEHFSSKIALPRGLLTFLKGDQSHFDEII
jgi:hypothetical protein